MHEDVWHTRNTVSSSVAVCNFNFGAGYHRPYVVEFQVHSLLEELVLPFRFPNKRILMCSLPIVVNRHFKQVESRFKFHLIPIKTQQLKEK